MKKIKIGDLELNGYVYIPPMAGVTNIAFRKIVRHFDKDTLIATEMVSSKALSFKQDQKRMELSNDEHPVGIQIFGHEEDVMADAARLAQDKGADFVDINMGCPVPKITCGKDGAALMKEPDLAVSIARSVVNSVKIPVTVKMRLGWDDCNKNAPELAKRLEDIGIKALTVHGRTRAQKYEGKANWEEIKKVKENVSIPVFGNGDIRTPEDAKKLIEISGCDGVAVARGCMGSPWLSAQINSFLKNGYYNQEPEFERKLEIALMHVRELVELKGEDIGIRESRRHIMTYLKGFSGAARLREKVCSVNKLNEVEDILLALKS